MSQTFSYKGHCITFDRTTLDTHVPDRGHQKKWNAPPWLRQHLVRYMLEKNYFRAKNIVCSDSPLDQFCNDCGMEAATDPRAKKLFKTTVHREATEITRRIQSQGGIGGQIKEKGTSYCIVDPFYLRGYEHILDDDWDGVLVRKFVDISDITKSLSYGWERGLYTADELDELKGLLGLLVRGKSESPSTQSTTSASLHQPPTEADRVLGTQESIACPSDVSGVFFDTPNLSRLDRLFSSLDLHDKGSNGRGIPMSQQGDVADGVCFKPS